MRDIEIFIKGRYEYRYNLITIEYYLNYKKAVIKHCEQEVCQSTSAGATLKALDRALDHITEPCNIVVHSKYDLGIGKPKNSKNKVIIESILKKIAIGCHVVEYDTLDDFGRVRIWEELYGVTSIKSTDTVESSKEQEPFPVIQRQTDYKPYISNYNTPDEVFRHKGNSLSALDEFGDNDDDEGTWNAFSGGY